MESFETSKTAFHRGKISLLSFFSRTFSLLPDDHAVDFFERWKSLYEKLTPHLQDSPFRDEDKTYVVMTLLLDIANNLIPRLPDQYIKIPRDVYKFILRSLVIKIRHGGPFDLTRVRVLVGIVYKADSVSIKEIERAISEVKTNHGLDSSEMIQTMRILAIIGMLEDTIKARLSNKSASEMFMEMAGKIITDDQNEEIKSDDQIEGIKLKIQLDHLVSLVSVIIPLSDAEGLRNALEELLLLQSDDVQKIALFPKYGSSDRVKQILDAFERERIDEQGAINQLNSYREQIAAQYKREIKDRRSETEEGGGLWRADGSSLGGGGRGY